MMRARLFWVTGLLVEVDVMRIRSAVASTAFVVLGGQVANVQAEVVTETVSGKRHAA